MANGVCYNLSNVEEEILLNTNMNNRETVHVNVNISQINNKEILAYQRFNYIIVKIKFALTYKILFFLKLRTSLLYQSTQYKYIEQKYIELQMRYRDPTIG